MEKIIKAAAEPKLVKKEAYAAVLDAVTILDTARGQAQAILRDAEARAESIREEARRVGRLEAIEAAEGELIRLATAIARKIVVEELRTSPAVIVQIVRDAIASVRHGREVVVKVHPSAVADVRDGIGADAQVRGVEKIEPGGCIVESEFGSVDAQLDTKLRVIENALGSRE